MKDLENIPEKETNLQPGAGSTVPAVASSIGNMLFDPGVFERVTQMAGIMAESKAMVPQYLRGNESDCMAIIMQAAQWKMDPFAVAAKTYQIKPGAPIAYEAQLVNSIIIKNGPFKERPKYEFFGDWSRVQGKLKEMRSEKGKYAVPDWKPDDEEGLGVTVTLHVIGEDEPTSMNVLLKQCWPRNSTNWANDPQQQICYSAIRKMARRHFPDVIMGLYTPDELQYAQPAEKDVTPDNSVESLLPAKPEKPEDRARRFFKSIKQAKTPAELKSIGKDLQGEKDDVTELVRTAYMEKLEELRPKPKQDAGQYGPEADEPSETVDKETGEVKGNDQGAVDPATLMKMIETADGLESLDDIMDMADGLDKRSKVYKDIVNMVGVRREEMTPDEAAT